MHFSIKNIFSFDCVVLDVHKLHDHECKSAMLANNVSTRHKREWKRELVTWDVLCWEIRAKFIEIYPKKNVLLIFLIKMICWNRPTLGFNWGLINHWVTTEISKFLKIKSSEMRTVKHKLFMRKPKRFCCYFLCHFSLS